jgi:hypothetical protein
MLHEVFRCSEIEPRIDYGRKLVSTSLSCTGHNGSTRLTLMDDALEADNGEKSRGDSSGCDGTQDDET